MVEKRLKIVAIAIFALVLCSISMVRHSADVPRSINYSDAASCTLNLKTGWNLVSFPVDDSPTTPSRIFTGLDYYVDYVIYYWSTSGGYNVQDPNAVLMDNLGYWVYVKMNTALTWSGTVSTNRDISLVTGWNLVGFPDNTTPNSLFAPLVYTIDYYIYWFSGGYKLQGSDTGFKDNVGYWVWINTNKTIMIDPPINNPPYAPFTPWGASSGYVGTAYTYTTSATDPDGNSVRYRFDWGDGNISGWTDWKLSGLNVNLSHSWNSAGTYQVRVQAEDSNYATSDWSGSCNVVISNSTSPDFNISISSASGIIYRGDYINPTVTVTGVNGYSRNVRLTANSGAATVTFSKANGVPTFSSSLTISCVIPETETIFIYGVGDDGKTRACSYTLTTVNQKPNKPTIAGSSNVIYGSPSTYYATGTDPESDSVKYYFDWDDGSGEWSNWVSSGQQVHITHVWSGAGTYNMKVKSRDSWGAESEWSDNVKIFADDDMLANEVGVWAVGDIPNNSLPFVTEDAQEFYDVLVGQGYTGRFTLYNIANVREAQLQDPAKSNSNGEDYMYSDSCDFIWFEDHGDPAKLYTGWTGTRWIGYPNYVSLTDSVRWGDLDMEWAFILACDVLDQNVCVPNGGQIAGAFDTKLHGICGFSTVAYVGVTLGRNFAQYATGVGYGTPHPIGQSWEYATRVKEANMPTEVWGAWLSGSTNDFTTVFADEDYFPASGTGMLPDPNYSSGWCRLYYTWKCEFP